MSVKVLLDTDPGTDIDDAVCLAYLLAQPACELLGITTVTGEPERRAAIASAVCHAYDRPDIPIFPGASEPLLVPQRQKDAPQARALGSWKHRTEFPVGEAVPFLRSTIRANPGEVTLLAVGPLTNVALLFSEDPEIPSLLKGLVLMGGRFDEDGKEHNTTVDPHATEIVFRARPPLHRSVGIDVTRHTWLDLDQTRAFLSGPRLGVVREMAEIWFEWVQGMTLHDPLAAATIFEPSLCPLARGQVDVEEGGVTRWRPEEGGPHEVATAVDREAFLRHLGHALQAK